MTLKQRLEKVAARPKLADEIAATLRQAILGGVYEKDTKLGLEELAQELGVSIMPVREALIALSKEGLVVAEPRRGFRAHPLTQDDVDDLSEIQGHLAGILASRAAAVASNEDIAQLRDIQAQFVHAATLDEGKNRDEQLEQLNADFHRTLNQIPGGDRVRWFLRLTNKFVRHNHFTTVSGMIENALNDHPAIIDALQARNSNLARVLTEAHYAQAAHLVNVELQHAAAESPSDHA